MRNSTTLRDLWSLTMWHESDASLEDCLQYVVQWLGTYNYVTHSLGSYMVSITHRLRLVYTDTLEKPHGRLDTKLLTVITLLCFDISRKRGCGLVSNRKWLWHCWFNHNCTEDEIRRDSVGILTTALFLTLLRQNIWLHPIRIQHSRHGFC